MAEYLAMSVNEMTMHLFKGTSTNRISHRVHWDLTNITLKWMGWGGIAENFQTYANS